MAKRFTDSDKWKKPFIRGLDAPYKLLWLYILDECNHAGIWHVEMDVAEIRICGGINIETAKKQFKNHIVEIDNGEKWFIPDFIEFQYGELNPENRAHNSVISLLKKYNLMKKNKPLTSPLQGAKDKDKDKDMDKEGESEGDKEKFGFALKIYPGTKRGLDTELDNYKKKHKDWKGCLELLLPAIKKQKDWRERTDDFVPPWKHFPTWINNRCWEEEVPEEEKIVAKANPNTMG